MLIYKTVLPRSEKRIKETSRGQNDVWTGKNGDKKITIILKGRKYKHQRVQILIQLVYIYG